ncbi:hypothetical protein, conserved [Eimeria tenella]|uniref:Uncharacterized protein n=1 Tax=Eimeria tenella TaxID=5802 RepID=U6KLJ1_EIMTE|nr:hypothetical protein, conserved [Eimeria tenella]CDJ37691.1 hypothetical protein, conserved [Eimeria tenella]|eukprot:XP_013228529.1 hypothetical protein, conserved [Eimeria tenella]
MEASILSRDSLSRIHANKRGEMVVYNAKIAHLRRTCESEAEQMELNLKILEPSREKAAILKDSTIYTPLAAREEVKNLEQHLAQADSEEQASEELKEEKLKEETQELIKRQLAHAREQCQRTQRQLYPQQQVPQQQQWLYPQQWQQQQHLQPFGTFGEGMQTKPTSHCCAPPPDQPMNPVQSSAPRSAPFPSPAACTTANPLQWRQPHGLYLAAAYSEASSCRGNSNPQQYLQQQHQLSYGQLTAAGGPHFQRVSSLEQPPSLQQQQQQQQQPSAFYGEAPDTYAVSAAQMQALQDLASDLENAEGDISPSEHIANPPWGPQPRPCESSAAAALGPPPAKRTAQWHETAAAKKRLPATKTVPKGTYRVQRAAEQPQKQQKTQESQANGAAAEADACNISAAMTAAAAAPAPEISSLDSAQIRALYLLQVCVASAVNLFLLYLQECVSGKKLEASETPQERPTPLVGLPTSHGNDGPPAGGRQAKGRHRSLQQKSSECSFGSCQFEVDL